MVTDDEERKIREEVQRNADFDHRLTNLEAGQRRIWIGFGAAALMIFTSIWEKLWKVLSQ
jgi:hypothetical protein